MQTAIELVTKAVECDEKHNYKEAYYLYCNSLQYFVPLITEEQDATKRMALRNRAMIYLKRAEEIKTSLLMAENKAASQCQTSDNIKTEVACSSNQTNSISNNLEPDVHFKQLCKYLIQLSIKESKLKKNLLHILQLRFLTRALH